MFLDYDGTLSPIVDDPDRAIMSDAVRTRTFYYYDAFWSETQKANKLTLSISHRCVLLLKTWPSTSQQQLLVVEAVTR